MRDKNFSKLKTRIEIGLIILCFLIASINSVSSLLSITDDNMTDDTHGIIMDFTGNWLLMNNITLSNNISVNKIITLSGDLSLNPVGNVTTESNFTIGNSTNHFCVNETGYLTLHGNARTSNALWVDAGGIKSPGLKPAAEIAHGTLETPAWEFGNEAVAGNQESVSWSMRLPHRMDRSVAPTIAVGWSANGVSPGVCEWQLEYLWASVDEDTTAGAQEILTVNSTASSTSNGLIVSSFAGIDVPNATDACIHCKLTRLSAGTNDTIAGTVELHGVCLDFTSNKMGSTIC